jgi:hypothetical protein
MAPRLLLLIVALLVVWLAPARASACAACNAGDPTLTTMGFAQPFAGRLRGAAELSHRETTIGTPDLDRFTLREQRLDLSVTYMPTRWLMLGALLPAVRRHVVSLSGAKDTSLGLGDPELRTRWALLQRQGRQKHVLWATAALAMPGQPPFERQGEPLAPERQTSSGAITPSAGLAYALFSAPYALFASSSFFAPIAVTLRSRPGAALRSSLAGQVQPLRWLGLRLSVDHAHEWPGRELDGARDPHSGGDLLALAPALLLSPNTDLVFQAVAQLPVLTRLHDQDQGPLFTIGALYDF